MSDLDELERRVTEKFAAKCAELVPADPFDPSPFDPACWSSSVDFGQPAVQFPREQWVTYPHRRMLALMTADRVLDFELTEEQWMQAGMLVAFGGRERIA